MAKIWQRVKQNLRRERLLFLSNICVMSITFFILGLFITVVMASQTALKALEQQAQITVFFKDDFLEPSILQLKAKYDADTRILETKYVSKQEAFNIFTEVNKDVPALMDSASPDILPASLEIKTKEIKDLNAVNDELQKTDGVEEIKFFRDVIERFKDISTLVYILGFGLVAVFLIVSYSVILVTLRIIITSKGKELEIMKLVGASDVYVRSPLVYQGVFLGVVSSLISSALLFAVAALIQFSGFYNGTLTLAFLPDLGLTPVVYALFLSLILLLSGFILGYVGSYSAIKRYLRY